MPLDPATGILAGGQALSGLISGIIGLGQTARAKRMAALNKRPTYAIPTEILQNQALASQLSNVGMPGGEYELAKQGIERGSSTALRSASDRRGGLATVSAVNKQEQDALNRLNVENAQQRLSNIRNLMSQNQVLANYRDKAFQYNQAQNYEENAAAIRALQGAGWANIGSGLNSILGAGATAASGATTGIPKTTSTASGPNPFNLQQWMNNRDQINPQLSPFYKPQSYDPTTDKAFFPDYTSGVMDYLKNWAG